MELVTKRPGPEVIKLIPCSTQLSSKFILLINVKMPTIVDIQNTCDDVCLILICLSRMRTVLLSADPEGGRGDPNPTPWKITSCYRFPQNDSRTGPIDSRDMSVRTALCEIR